MRALLMFAECAGIFAAGTAALAFASRFNPTRKDQHR